MKFLIAGLGNMGDEYVNTRHNIGFWVADKFVADSRSQFSTGRLADVARLSIKGRIFIVIKPSTFMNLSGKAVRYWMNKENLLPENLLVITDDLSLPTGVLRLRKKGSDGGHNGLINIIEHLGTNEFPRLRIGIGADFERGRQVDYVLSQWFPEEIKVLTPKIEQAAGVIKNFGLIGIDRTMNLCNRT